MIYLTIIMQDKIEKITVHSLDQAQSAIKWRKGVLGFRCELRASPKRKKKEFVGSNDGAI